MAGATTCAKVVGLVQCVSAPAVETQMEPLSRASAVGSLRRNAFFAGPSELQELAAGYASGKRAVRKSRGSNVAQAAATPLPATHTKLSNSSAAALAELRKMGANRYTSEKSSIMVVGLSVHTAPVEMREKLAVPEAEWPRAIAELCECPHIEEAGVLSTCNRMEIYVVALSWKRGVREVTEWMSKTSGVPVEELRPHLFLLREKDATMHLLRVSSGLDSLVLGEGQILAQVKQVYNVGQPAPGFGRNLNSLFKQALTAGKRVRTETNISSGAVSVSSAAVELAALKLPEGNFANARVMIVGAGKMSRLLVKHLLSKGCSKMVLLNRSEQRAVDLANDFQDAEIKYEPLTELLRCAGEADVIFTSTASDLPLYTKENVSGLPPAAALAGALRHFVDISVPRNVGACVNEVEGSCVYNVDDLWEVVAANKEDRRRKAKEAESILEEERLMFESWRDSLETVPTIKKLRAKAENIRIAELEKCLSKLGDGLGKKERKLIEELTRGIVNKLMHGPMQHLRCDGNSDRTVGDTILNMQALERMFDLASQSPTPEEIRAKVEASSRS